MPVEILQTRVDPVDYRAAINQAFILVVPSVWYEVFPVVIMEAFARGIPVIASRLGTMQEVVEDGKTGILFEPSDPADLAEKVRWAFAHRKEMNEMGKAARACYLERYAPEMEHSSLMKIFDRASESNMRKWKRRERKSGTSS